MNTIQASELRIGNLVNIKAHADGLGISAIGIHNFQKGIIEVEPIPLNEDWFVRLGLIQRSDMKQCFLLKCVDERVFCVYLDLTVGYQLLIETNKDSGVWHVIAKDLKHVHTLQNLIHALTGTELTLTDKYRL